MRVLVVKLSSLGDVVQTMPVVNDILKAHPKAQIDWVVEEAFAPLVERVRGVHHVFAIAERRWRKARFHPATRQQRAAFSAVLQAQAYDAVIDFQGLIKSALVARRARLAPGGFRATYANGSDACSYEWPVRFMVNRPIAMAQRIHAVARYRSLAAQALGYEVQGTAVYRLQSNALRAVKTVVFAHGTTRPDNEWPAERWIALGRQLIEQGYQIALPQANPQELALCDRILLALADSSAQGESVATHQKTAFTSSIAPAAAGGTAGAVFGGSSVVIWPRLSLAQVLDHMAGCAGVIGVDSGLSHLAVALGLPHVQIFSQPRAWRAGPQGQAHQCAVGGEAAPDVQTVWHAWQVVTDVNALNRAGQTPVTRPATASERVS